MGCLRGFRALPAGAAAPRAALAPASAARRRRSRGPTILSVVGAMLASRAQAPCEGRHQALLLPCPQLARGVRSTKSFGWRMLMHQPLSHSCGCTETFVRVVAAIKDKLRRGSFATGVSMLLCTAQCGSCLVVSRCVFHFDGRVVQSIVAHRVCSVCVPLCRLYRLGFGNSGGREE